MRKVLRRANLFLVLFASFWCVGPARGGDLRVSEYLVNSLGDPDDGQIDFGDATVTLREAILLANADRGASRIKIDASLQNGIIQLGRGLPPITEGGLEMDGNTNLVNGTPVMPIRLLAPPDAEAAGIFILRVQCGGNVFRNLVLGGSHGGGIQLSGAAASLNLINACALGTDMGGNLANDILTLALGIHITNGASDNTVSNCTISNCARTGLLIDRNDCRRNIITKNVIGSLSSTTAGNGTGVHLRGSATLLGGLTSSGANTIAKNTLNGVLVEGPGAMFNRILNNSFEANGRLAIDLSAVGGIGDGPTPDGQGGPQASQGPNQWVAAPKLLAYQRLSLPAGVYRYTIQGICQTPMSIQAYQADPDPLGYGEGKTVLATSATLGGNSFLITFTAAAGVALTLLGTDTNGNTSEFSQVFTLGEGGDVTQLACWQNLYFIPQNGVRLIGVGTNRRNLLDTHLNFSFSSPAVARVLDPPPIPPDSTYILFQVEGLTPGSTSLRLALPSTAGGAACSTTVMVDQPYEITINPQTERTDTLNGPIPARLYKFTGNAGQLIDVSVAAIPGSPVDPVISLFDDNARNLADNDNFRGPASFIQQLLPHEGDFYIAVHDLNFRTGDSCQYTLKLWPEPLTPSYAPHQQLTEREPVGVQDRPNSLAFGDLNGDGFKDLVLPLPGRNAFQILFKDAGSAIQFSNSFTQNLTFSPGATTVADFDRDGRDDILVNDLTNHAVHVFYNTGQWAKAGASGASPGWRHLSFPAGGSGSAGTSSDFNQDSFPDYAQLDTTQNTLSILINDGLGNLSQVQTLAAGSRPIGLAASDFDGDGVPDLALADGGQETLLIWEGLGDGTFTLTKTIASVAQPTDLKATDLDLDGQGDLIVCGQQDNVLVTYKSLQSFDFQLYQQLSTGSLPNSIALADLNADGFQDVSVSNSGSQDIYVYQGMRAGWLQAVAQISVDGQIEQLFWYSFGGYGSYFGVPPDENFIRMLEGNYRVLNFLDAEDNTDYSTAFALANPSGEDTLVYLSLYNLDGSLVADSGVENPVALTLPGAEQAAFFVNDVFGSAVESYPSWMRISTLNQYVQGFSLLLSNAEDPFYDGAIAQTSAEPHLLLPVIGTLSSASDDYVDIVNPGTETASVTLTCRGPDGAVMGVPLQLQLAAKARLSMGLGEQFGQLATPFYLDIEASQPLEGFQFARAGGTMSATNAIPVIGSESGTSNLYGAHFAEGRLYRTVLNLVNASPNPAEVTIQALQDDGTLMAASQPVAVPPHGMLHGDLATLLGLDYQSADFITGYLRIGSSQPMLYGTLTFGDRAGQTFSASLVLQSEGAGHMLFSHLAVGDVGGVNYFTGLTFLNAGPTDASFHLAVYDQQGVLTGENTIVLPAGHKLSQMLTDFVTGLSPQGQGYITVDAAPDGVELFSFELFGDAGLNFLAAVPPQAPGGLTSR